MRDFKQKTDMSGDSVGDGIEEEQSVTLRGPSSEFLLCLALYGFQEIRLHLDLPQNLMG